jgi:hypothetical protein
VAGGEAQGKYDTREARLVFWERRGATDLGLFRIFSRYGSSSSMPLLSSSKSTLMGSARRVGMGVRCTMRGLVEAGGSRPGPPGGVSPITPMHTSVNSVRGGIMGSPAGGDPISGGDMGTSLLGTKARRGMGWQTDEWWTSGKDVGVVATLP